MVRHAEGRTRIGGIGRSSRPPLELQESGVYSRGPSPGYRRTRQIRWRWISRRQRRAEDRDSRSSPFSADNSRRAGFFDHAGLSVDSARSDCEACIGALRST